MLKRWLHPESSSAFGDQASPLPALGWTHFFTDAAMPLIRKSADRSPFSIGLIWIMAAGRPTLCLADDAPSARTPLCETGQMDQPAKPVRLFGGVEEQQDAGASTTGKSSLQPEKPAMVPPAVQMSTEQSRISGFVSENKIWFQIPPWLAGVWRTQNKALLAEINYRTGKQAAPHDLNFGYCGEHYGWQKDEHGGYWQYTEANNRPSNYRVDARGVVHFDVIDSYHPVYSSANEFVLNKIWHSVSFDSSRNRQTSRSFTSTMSFTLVGHDLIKITEAVRSFDARGNLLTFREVQTLKYKIGSFAELNERQGENVQAAFNDYRVSRNAVH